MMLILKDDLTSAAINMSAKLENSAVAIGLEKVSFHSNPKEGQRTLMLGNIEGRRTRWLDGITDSMDIS